MDSTKKYIYIQIQIFIDKSTELYTILNKYLYIEICIITNENTLTCKETKSLYQNPNIKNTYKYTCNQKALRLLMEAIKISIDSFPGSAPNEHPSCASNTPP